MSTQTLPRIAADLEGNGRPFYAARYVVDTDPQPDVCNVVWRPTPTLLDDTMRWADDRDHIGTDHLDLDVYVTAQLLAHDITVNPDALSAEDAAAVIDRELVKVGCDMYRCCLEIYADEADHPNASQRWDRCVLAAGRLLKASV